MDSREISARLHDILRSACRVRQPGPGRTAEANIETIDEVKGGLRALIAELGEQEPPRLPPRLKASAAAFPEGRIAGTRTTVQHRRRIRMATHQSEEGRPERQTGGSRCDRLAAPGTADPASARRGPFQGAHAGRGGCGRSPVNPLYYQSGRARLHERLAPCRSPAEADAADHLARSHSGPPFRRLRGLQVR